jgi:Na+/H+ antiporter NhaD/arsenite permease-like protein
VAVLVLAGAATGVGFGVSPRLGFVLVGVTLVVTAVCVAWLVREGRRRRAAGLRPDLDEVEHRMRRHLRWMLPLFVVGVVLAVIGLATRHDGRGPTWVVVAGPVLSALVLIWSWLIVRFLLPRLKEKQQSDA